MDWREKLFGKVVVKCDDKGQFQNIPTLEALADCLETGDGTVCGIYFSFANISDASDDFGVRLEEVYRKVQPRLRVVEVVLWAHVGTPEGPVEREAGFRRTLTGKPWFAVPFHDVDTKRRLTQKYSIAVGVPTLVIRGRPVRDALLEDPLGERFPWPAPPLIEVLRGVPLEGEGETKFYEDLPADSLRVFYFAAHWCPPCRAFSPSVCAALSAVRKRRAKFANTQLILVSSDSCKEAAMWGTLALILVGQYQLISGEPPSRIVNTAQGPVRGYKDEEYGFYTFKNIPYASAPTGPNKFKAPLPPPVWQEPLEAVDRGVICPQAAQVFPFPKGRVMKEDCLIANVYVPDTEEKNLPVVVYVHGGAFFMGYGDWIVPKQFIKENNVVFINFNYRLGTHGFLSLGTKDVPGNAGMKDQVALLRWVKKNIHSFGGNPDDVTIQGVSSGSSSVDLLMLSKSVDGLFNKVIAESGASIAAFAIQPDPLASARTYAQFLNFTNVDDVYALEEFYKTVPIDLLQLDPFYFKTDSTFLFSPCVEATGEEMFLDRSPVDILKSGDYKKVPLLYGFSRMEGLIRIDLFDEWKQKMNENFADFLPLDLKFDSEEQKAKVANSVKEFYFGDKSVSEENILDYVDFFTDVIFAYPMLRTVKYQVEAGHDEIYLYRFSFVDENSRSIPHTDLKGADHCSQSAAVVGEWPVNPDQNNSVEFKNMSAVMRAMWGNFVKTGSEQSYKRTVQSVSSCGALSVPWSSAAARLALPTALAVGGIPALVVTDAVGTVLTADGRRHLASDPLALNFPWSNRPVSVLTEPALLKMARHPALVLFIDDEDSEIEFAESVLTPSAESYYEECSIQFPGFCPYQNSSDDESMDFDYQTTKHSRIKKKPFKHVMFFIGIDGTESADMLREHISLDDAVPLLTAIDFPKQRMVTMRYGDEITTDSVQNFVDSYLSGNADFKPLKPYTQKC